MMLEEEDDADPSAPLSRVAMRLERVLCAMAVWDQSRLSSKLRTTRSAWHTAIASSWIWLHILVSFSSSLPKLCVRALSRRTHSAEEEIRVDVLMQSRTVRLQRCSPGTECTAQNAPEAQDHAYTCLQPVPSLFPFLSGCVRVREARAGAGSCLLADSFSIRECVSQSITTPADLGSIPFFVCTITMLTSRNLAALCAASSQARPSFPVCLSVVPLFSGNDL